MMKLLTDSDAAEINCPIANGSLITVNQWGQEKIFLYQEGAKYNLGMVLRALCKEIDPMRDPEEIFK